MLDDALDGLQKHLRPLLPVSKSMMTQVFDALKLQPTKKIYRYRMRDDLGASAVVWATHHADRPR